MVPYNLPIAGEAQRWIHVFEKALARSETQTDSSKSLTRVAKSISNTDSYYTS